MEAIKKTRVKKDGNKIILYLPDTFVANEVDVLIWPSDEVNDKTTNNISSDLLQWPEMTDDELALVEEKRKHINAWK